MFLRGGIKIFLNSKFIFSTPRAKRDSNCLCLIFEKCILGRVDVLVVIKGHHYGLSIILGLSVKKQKRVGVAIFAKQMYINISAVYLSKSRRNCKYQCV